MLGLEFPHDKSKNKPSPKALFYPLRFSRLGGNLDGCLSRDRSGLRELDGNDTLHYSTFMGKIATIDSWKSEPFEYVVEIPYSSNFSEKEFRTMKAGLIPEAMEDKWFVYFKDGHLLIHRSWTGMPVYKVKIQKIGEGYKVGIAYMSVGLVNDDKAYQANLLNFLVSNLLLGKSVPFPNDNTFKEKIPGIVQHGFSGTGYPEIIVGKRKPWWKFWN